MDEFSVSEALAEVFDESWVAGFGRLVELLVAIVGLVGGEQADGVPAFDRVMVDAELLGDLAQGEHPGRAEPRMPAAEAMVLAQAFDDIAGERLPVEGAEVLLVEDRGDLALG